MGRSSNLGVVLLGVTLGWLLLMAPAYLGLAIVGGSLYLTEWPEWVRGFFGIWFLYVSYIFLFKSVSHWVRL